MQRRDFLRTLVGGVAAAAAIRTWPFRVYSFPSAPKLLQKETAAYITSVLDANQFHEGDMVWILHPDQAKAWDRLKYRISKVDAQKRTIEFKDIRQSQYNWKNLSRSSSPRRAGVT